jgi:hypothetical protein
MYIPLYFIITYFVSFLKCLYFNKVDATQSRIDMNHKGEVIY